MSNSDDRRQTPPPPPRSFKEFLGGQAKKISAPADPKLSEVVLGQGCAPLPERLLLAHGEGKVLFLAGAGVSMAPPSRQPGFRDLVLQVYRRLNDPLLRHLRCMVKGKAELPLGRGLTSLQKAEAENFRAGRLDVVLGMLERRIDGNQTEESRVRRAVIDELRPRWAPGHAGLHRDLIRLAARGSVTTILTTNFDLLLEDAAQQLGSRLDTHALGGIPRPTERPSFRGVLHLHGALRPDGSDIPDLIITDQDFGKFYLRRRAVADLLYDAARIFHIVLVGYTAGDPPVRYLLDAISADDAGFPDLKERFVLVPCKGDETDRVTRADWEARGVTPIAYARGGDHAQLAVTLKSWADLLEKKQTRGEKDETVTMRRVLGTLERITDTPLSDASDEDRSLFDHLIWREGRTQRAQFTNQLGELRRHYGWLDRILEVLRTRLKDVAPGVKPRDQLSAEAEEEVGQHVWTFARDRLEEKATVDWARRLPATDDTSRHALRRLLSRRRASGDPLPELWSTAWQLVEESWRPLPYAERDEAMGVTSEINRRLRRDDRSFALAEKMADFAATGVRLNDPWESIDVGVGVNRAPTSCGDLFHAELRSAVMTEFRRLELAGVDDPEFLSCLIRALEAVVRRGLDLGRWIQGMDDFSVLGLGWHQRVYLVGDGGDATAEAVARGIAPSVKLLHAAMKRLACVSPKSVSRILQGWRRMDCPLHRRLWAALARCQQLVPASEVEEALHALPDSELWGPGSYPELWELLALRFGDLDSSSQRELLTRLRRGPSGEVWPGVDAEQAREWGVSSTVRQMTEARDTVRALPVEFEEWLEARLAERPELRNEDVDFEFTSAAEVGSDRAEPNWELDGYRQRELLAELEERLAREQPFYRGGAGAWFESRSTKVLEAMAAEDQTGLDLPHVWGAIGWRYRPPDDDRSADIGRDACGEAVRILELIQTLSDETLAKLVEDLVRWWGNWQRHVQPASLARQVWLRLWPHAVEATNAMSDEGSLEYDLSNTPAGVLGCGVSRLAPEPSGKQRLSKDAEFGEILAVAVKATSRAGRAALAWLVCDVGWYLRVDAVWAQRYLVPALQERAEATKEHSESAIALWDTLCRLGLAGGVPRVLAADAMDIIERADEPKLGAWSRQRLLSKLVWVVLRSFFQGRERVVEAPELQQLLRRLDDEMRGWCATELWRCLVKHGDDLPEERFDKAVAPFLEQVWPKERSLVSRGVSHVMAGIPAASGGKFVAAVDAVARYLVPGSVTSCHDYGLYGEEDDEPVLKVVVNTEEKAEALLRLLELTVGSGDDATTPWDLDELLVRIREVAPELVERPEFAQLTTMAQRSRFQ